MFDALWPGLLTGIATACTLQNIELVFAGCLIGTIVGMQCLRQSPNGPIAGQVPILEPEVLRQCRLGEAQRHRG